MRFSVKFLFAIRPAFLTFCLILIVVVLFVSGVPLLDWMELQTYDLRFLARDRLAALLKERDAKRAGAFTTDSDPNVQEFKGADYFLTGELKGLSTRTSKGTSDYILYAFQLVDARTSAIVWEDNAEIKKQGLEDAAYR